MARPTKLTAAVLKQAEEYLAETTVMGVHALLPTIEGLALKLDIHRATLHDWDEAYPAFHDILERLRSAQAQKIIQNSMVGKYNSTISKLLLSKHDYIERKDVTSDGKAISNIVELPKQLDENFDAPDKMAS